MIQQTTGILATIKSNLLEFITLAFLWLSPIHGLVVFILIAIGVDTLLGRKAAKVIAIREGKEPRLEVTSRKTRLGFLSKAASYIGILILTLFLDRIMLNDLLLYFLPTLPIQFLVTKGLGIILLLIEADSADEKYFIITGKRFKDTIKKKVAQVKSLILGAKKFKDEIEGDE
jgi:hypothetical protein